MTLKKRENDAYRLRNGVMRGATWASELFGVLVRGDTSLHPIPAATLVRACRKRVLNGSESRNK